MNLHDIGSDSQPVYLPSVERQIKRAKIKTYLVLALLVISVIGNCFQFAYDKISSMTLNDNYNKCISGLTLEKEKSKLYLEFASSFSTFQSRLDKYVDAKFNLDTLENTQHDLIKQYNVVFTDMKNQSEHYKINTPLDDHEYDFFSMRDGYKD